MRRLCFALVLLIVAAASSSAQAQGWGPGLGRPCLGFCRPSGPPFGFAPWRFGPLGFRPAPWGWGWRPAAWRRQMQRRRFMAWRRWAKTAERPAAPPEVASREGATPRFDGWVWPGRPAPAVATTREAPRPALADRNEAVASVPPAALRVGPHARSAIPSRVLAAAAMVRRDAPVVPHAAPVTRAVVRPPESPPRPAALRRPGAEWEAPRRAVVPVALPPRPAPVPPSPALPGPAPAVAPPPTGDVPVAPLD